MNNKTIPEFNKDQPNEEVRWYRHVCWRIGGDPVAAVQVGVNRGWIHYPPVVTPPAGIVIPQPQNKPS